jgi:hypothetical protein
MHLEHKAKYKKVDGIYTVDDKISKWQKFWIGMCKFIIKGLAGRWEFNINIKF